MSTFFTNIYEYGPPFLFPQVEINHLKASISGGRGGGGSPLTSIRETLSTKINLVKNVPIKNQFSEPGKETSVFSARADTNKMNPSNRHLLNKDSTKEHTRAKSLVQNKIRGRGDL